MGTEQGRSWWTRKPTSACGPDANARITTGGLTGGTFSQQMSPLAMPCRHLTIICFNNCRTSILKNIHFIQSTSSMKEHYCFFPPQRVIKVSLTSERKAITTLRRSAAPVCTGPLEAGAFREGRVGPGGAPARAGTRRPGQAGWDPWGESLTGHWVWRPSPRRAGQPVPKSQHLRHVSTLGSQVRPAKDWALSRILEPGEAIQSAHRAPPRATSHLRLWQRGGSASAAGMGASIAWVWTGCRFPAKMCRVEEAAAWGTMRPSTWEPDGPGHQLTACFSLPVSEGSWA